MSADPVRWFDIFGTCGCGKPATGTMRGPRNESYGRACMRCGEARVKRALKEQEAELRNRTIETGP
jgi:hypothetical protein